MSSNLLNIESLKFDEDYYSRSYRSIAIAYKGALKEHYMCYGKNEGKAPFNFMREQKISLSEIAPIDYIKNTSFAIHVHASEVEMMDKILIYLGNVPFKYSLFISTNSEYDASRCYEMASQLPMLLNLDVSIMSSYKGNFLALSKILNENLKQFDYICHIHTQKDDERLFGWKTYLLNQLLGSEIIIKKHFTLLAQSQTGLIFPEAFFLLPENDLHLKKIVNKCSLNFRQSLFEKFQLENMDNTNYFPTGGMFWAKTSALTALIESNLSVDDFEGESDKNSRTALEALLEGLIAASSICKKYNNIIIVNDYSYKGLPVSNSEKHEHKSYVKNFISKYLFDIEYYYDMYYDVAKAKINPLHHYQQFGIAEQRCPCATIPHHIIESVIAHRNKQYGQDAFNLQWYLSSYTKIGEEFIFSDIDPYRHYIEIGKSEGKLPNNDLYQKWLNNNQNFCEPTREVKVSVIIPVYNSAKYLFGCITSALSQSLRDIEIIIINDGSTDTSQLIIDSFLNTNSNISCIMHEQNLGLVDTHNDGIAKAKGKYFTILDGDDWLDTKFCEIMYATAEAYKAELVCCVGARVFTKKANEREHSELINLHLLEGDNIDKAIGFAERNKAKIHYGLNRKLHRTDTWLRSDPLMNLDSSFIIAEDHVATIRFCQNITRAVYIQNNLYNWFVNLTSVSFRDRSKKDIEDYFYSIQSVSTCIEQQSMVYIQNLRSIFIYELFPSLKTLAKNKTDDVIDLLEFLAEKIDENRHLFPNEFFLEIKEAYCFLYIQLYGPTATKGDSLVFVDSHLIHDLRDYVLPYWQSKIPMKYIGLNYRKPFSASLQDIRDAMTARLVVASGGWNKKLFDTASPILQLWHGMGALKKVPVSQPLPIKKIYISSSDVAFAYARLFSLKEAQILPYGTIQSDYYLDDDIIASYRKSFFSKYPELQGKTLYLWCPTFRNSDKGYISPSLLDLARLEMQLKNDEILLYKSHPILAQNEENTLYLKNVFNNLVSCKNYSNEDLKELLAVADVFMTDYSSSLFYALLRNIPIVIYANDFEHYKYNPGLEIDLKEKIPGSVITEPDISKILAVLRSASADTEEYKQFRHFHLGACDGMSKERIFSDIKLTYFKEMKL